MARSEFTFPPRTQEQSKELVSDILWTLYHFGPFEDEASGRATLMLWEALAERGFEIGQGRLNVVLGEMETGGKYAEQVGAKKGLISRTTAGKRTYRIELVVSPDKFPFPPDTYGPDEIDYEWVEEGEGAAEVAEAAKAAAPQGANEADLNVEREPASDMAAPRASGPTSSAAEMVLKAISILNDACALMFTEQVDAFDAYMARHINGLDTLLQQFDETRRALASAEEANRMLQHTNAEQERTILVLQQSLK